jgi:ketosteroid isomerase-like protein
MIERQAIETEINPMLIARAEAFGRKDAAAAMSFVTDDIVHYSLAPPLGTRGKDEKGLQAWFDTWQSGISGDVHDVELTIGENVAFWTGYVNMIGTRSDGNKVDLWYRQTLGLVKTPSGWRVAHEHESVPFAIDGSGLGLFNLKP